MRYISGVVLVFAALILMLLGRREYFGYLEEHYALVSIAGLVVMIAGALNHPGFLGGSIL
jgi:hypothetical protein